MVREPGCAVWWCGSTGVLWGSHSAACGNENQGSRLLLSLILASKDVIRCSVGLGPADPNMGMLAGDGRVCRTRDVGLVQAVRREGLDLEGVSIRAHGLQSRELGAWCRIM